MHSNISVSVFVILLQFIICTNILIISVEATNRRAMIISGGKRNRLVKTLTKQRNFNRERDALILTVSI